MKLLTRVGGSLAALYLVCILFAAAAYGVKPVSVVQSAHADSSSSSAVVVKAEEVKREEVKREEVAEPADDQSVVAETADKIPDWLEVLTALIALASAVSVVTPTPKDNAVLIVLRKVLDVFALNVGAAKNAAAERNKNKLS